MARRGGLTRRYETARWPDRRLAPPAWPDQLALIALATLITVLVVHHGDPAWLVAAIFPIGDLLDGFETRARRRSAVRLGVTPANVPRLAPSPGCVIYMLATLAWLWRNPEPPKSAWSDYLATRIISAINERRSWHRAYRR